MSNVSGTTASSSVGSLFGGEVIRLLREDWPNATMLAQELYAIFQSDIPITTNAPVTSNSSNPEQAPFVANQFAGDGGILISFGDIGGIAINDGEPGFVDGDGNPITPSGGGGFPGQVQSGSGSGPYQVTIYPQGLSGPPATVNATQLQIDSSDSVPAGTWVLVTQAGGNYYMQAPVWLA